MVDLQAGEVRSSIAAPARGRRDWTKTPEAQGPVYGNRRRVRGVRGTRLMRRRGEYVERSLAHVDDTGGFRRTHLRGHQNILKRRLVHAGVQPRPAHAEGVRTGHAARAARPVRPRRA